MNNYNYGNSYGSNLYPNTNIILVTSLEEALYRTNGNGSDMVYFHQTEHVFYRIKVNAIGEKSWQTIRYSSPEPDGNAPLTKADLASIEERLSKLEKSMEVPHEQSVG